MQCEEPAPGLSVIDSADVLEGDLAAHVRECLRCQAEMARQRRLRHELERLGAGPVDAVEGLVDDILDALDDRIRHRRGRRAVYTVVAAAGAAGAAGAIMVANRARMRRLAG